MEDYHWQKDGSVAVLAANGFSTAFVSYSSDGAKHDLLPAPLPTRSFAWAPRRDRLCFAKTPHIPRKFGCGTRKRTSTNLPPKRGLEANTR